MSQSHHTLFNIPSSQYINEETFRILTESSENPMYKIAKAMHVTPVVTVGAVHTAQSCVYQGPECWWNPAQQRSAPRREAPIKTTHARRLDTYQPEPRRANASTITPKPVSRSPLRDVQMNATVEPTKRSSGGLERVHTITRRAGMAIKERRREEQEYRSVAAFYADAFY